MIDPENERGPWASVPPQGWTPELVKQWLKLEEEKTTLEREVFEYRKERTEERSEEIERETLARFDFRDRELAAREQEIANETSKQATSALNARIRARTAGVEVEG